MGNPRFGSKAASGPCQALIRAWRSVVVRTVAATQRLFGGVRIVAAQRDRVAVAFRPRLAPVLSSAGLGRDRSRRCRLVVAPCSRAGCPAASGPRRRRHGGAWTPGAPMDRIGCLQLRACGPNGCVAGTARATSRAGNPREAWVASCRTVAGSLRSGSRAVAPWWLPSVRHVPRGRRRNRCSGPVGVALAEDRPGRACAAVAAPEAVVAPGTLRVT